MSSGSKFEDESFDLSEIQGGEEHPIFLHDGTRVTGDSKPNSKNTISQTQLSSQMLTSVN